MSLWLAAAALVLAVATPLAWLQAPRPDPYVVPAIREPAWWLSPIECNAFRRLPVMVANLNAVFALPGTEQVWAVGDGGMIAHSADGGRTWQQQNRPPGNGSLEISAIKHRSTSCPPASARRRRVRA